MDVTVEHRDQVTVVTIVGSMDALTSGTVVNTLSTLVSQGNTRLVADLSQVDYMSSAGLRAILGTLKETRQHGGDFRLTGVQEHVRRVLDLSGFTNILKFYPDIESAVASFGT